MGTIVSVTKASSHYPISCQSCSASISAPSLKDFDTLAKQQEELNFELESLRNTLTTALCHFREESDKNKEEIKNLKLKLDKFIKKCVNNPSSTNLGSFYTSR